jgi:hypothetical protein
MMGAAQKPVTGLARKVGLTRTAFKRAEPKPPKGPKPRRCGNRACSNTYLPGNDMRVCWCSSECAEIIAKDRQAKQRAKQARADRAETKAKLAKLTPRRDLMAQAVDAFNAMIRLRDEGLPCICCGNLKSPIFWPGNQWDAGHYRSVGSAKHLQFDDRNVHRQLAYCNQNGAGRKKHYRAGLVERYGEEFAAALDADQTPRHYTDDDLRQIIATSRARIKELKAARADQPEEYTA